jgi:type IV secretory pathway TraG/TraD family ATPase VirD4
VKWQDLDHGNGSLVLGFSVIAFFMAAGLWRGRANAATYLAVPLYAIPAVITAGLITSGLSLVWHPGRRGSPRYAGFEFIALGIFAFVGFLAGRLVARGVPDKSHQRGTRIIDGTAAQRGRGVERGRSALKFGGIPVRDLDETKHFKLIGTTGTGKSTAIRALLAGALARGDRAVVADPDGGYVERFYDPKRGDVILNPFDARSAKWDIFSEVQQAYDIEQLARSLIPDGDSANASEWRGYARTLFSAVMKQSRALGVASGAELYRLLTAAPEAELRILLEATPAQPFLAEGNARMFGSIRSVTGSALSAFPYIDEQTSEAFSVRDWVRRGRGVLFIPYRADQIAALRDLIATWIRLAIFQTMSESEGDLKLWFIIDELDAVGRIDGLKDALARLRKFGGRCVLGFQSIGQVSAIYGHGEAQTIVENCGNTAIFRCSASEGGGTSRFASKLIGEREVIRLSTSTARGSPAFFSTQMPHKTTTTSEHYATEAAVMASEIEQLGDGIGFIKFASQPEWSRVQFPDLRQDKVAAAFSPRR